MKNFFFCVCIATCGALFFQSASAQTKTNTEVLRQAGLRQMESNKVAFQKLEAYARQKGWPIIIKKPDGGIIALATIDELGFPIYIGTDNNSTAAATIGTSKIWPGGALGLSLSGSSDNVKGKLGIWDGGNIRDSHVELVGRITQKDNSGSTLDHATHVAGTLIASGINPLAKGMSFQQKELIAYNYLNNSDIEEMFTEAPNLLVSNHSYGALAGWQFNNNRWEFYGQPNATEDYKFGYYSSSTQIWDSIAYNAPYYLIVKSAGNNRDENGPAVGSTYWRMNGSGTFMNAGPRPADISNNDSYDILSTTANAKNILVVGAVNPIASGYSKPADVVMSTFSSWGPTDDGRIKPDVVADGVNVLSSIDATDNSYSAFSGTSMASPTAAGSVMLLQEYYSQLHTGTFMRSATLRGLIIHTADEAGPDPGPDYQHGWGLINIAKAAAVIKANNTTDLIQEAILTNGNTATVNIIPSGNGPVVATLCWTDPKGTVIPIASALNNPAPKLVNDLDLIITTDGGATVFNSWKLNPASRASAATKGNNTLDNVEKIEFSNVIPGKTYTITISHKGALDRGNQAYSLLVSGVGGIAYCASGATTTAGSRIDSVSFATLQYKNTVACTNYSNLTSQTANVQSGQTLPLFVRVNNVCDATTASKVIKAYIDVNNDGDFTDAGENIAASAVLNGNADFTASVALPSNLNAGTYTTLRIVMQETSNPANVAPCGTFTAGETQDYRVFVSSPSNDVGITEVISPINRDCANSAQYVTVRITNFGSATQTNIPVTVEVKQGSTVITTLTGTFPGNIPANSNVVYLLQTPFNAAANTAYTFTARTSTASDQNNTNNQVIATITTASISSVPTGTSVICGTEALLKATPDDGSAYTWYSTLTGTVPVTVGANTTTTPALPTYFLARNEKLSISPATKSALGSGRYIAEQNRFMVFNNTVPVTLESMKLYIGNSNSTGKMNLIIGRNFSVANGQITFTPEAQVTLDIFATDPTPVPGTQPDDITDQGAIFYLNIPITATGDHIIIFNNPADNDRASMFKNENIAGAPYPIGISGLFTYKNNSEGFFNPPNNFQTSFYYMYDLKVKTGGCPSSSRATITSSTAVAPTITAVANVFTSSSATGNQWLKDGVDIPGEVNQTYAATSSGVYKVRVSNANGCSLESNEINFTATAVPNVDPARIGLVVSPIPARGSFNIQFEVTTRANLDISLLNTTGQRIYHSATPNFIGRLTKSINPGKVAAGVYYLQIIHDKKMYIRKVVITE